MELCQGPRVHPKARQGRSKQSQDSSGTTTRQTFSMRGVQTQIVGSFYGSMFDLPIRFASLAWLRARLREPPSASNEGFGQFESGFMCVGHL